MIFLRLACLAAGILVLVAPPAMLFPKGAGLFELSRSVTLLAALLLAASSFFIVGMTIHRIKRSPALGRLCALLLGAAFVAGMATMWHSAEPLALWMSGALLCFTLMVALVLAFLLLQEPSPSRVRAREKRQHRPPVLHHL
ncbi:hypothetical protein [Massilia sp. IC2-476]|uniref:hypothetical protein n=1 Tax=Massilia sp. IC2-476 TaxID=2887199 RepID=UPI001D0F8F93|nr:hypothetical protein [Massilia sp. IC2-476]MCC2971381.1 hypothetical protein [Massilia sp. IC2-476]